MLPSTRSQWQQKCKCVFYLWQKSVLRYIFTHIMTVCTEIFPVNFATSIYVFQAQHLLKKMKEFWLTSERPASQSDSLVLKHLLTWEHLDIQRVWMLKLFENRSSKNCRSRKVIGCLQNYICDYNLYVSFQHIYLLQLCYYNFTFNISDWYFRWFSWLWKDREKW